jgi:hypothetical protein
LPVYPRQKEQDKEGNSFSKACKKETMKNTPAPLAGSLQTLLTGKEQDKEGNSFGKACKKETVKNTPAAISWRSSNAHNRRCFSARYQFGNQAIRLASHSAPTVQGRTGDAQNACNGGR